VAGLALRLPLRCGTAAHIVAAETSSQARIMKGPATIAKKARTAAAMAVISPD
jgi:hypothetical protein